MAHAGLVSNTFTGKRRGEEERGREKRMHLATKSHCLVGGNNRRRNAVEFETLYNSSWLLGK